MTRSSSSLFPWIFVLALSLTGLVSSEARARKLFRSNIVVSGNVGGDSTNHLTDIPDLFDEDLLESIDSGYDELSTAVGGVLDIRGMRALVGFAQNSLTFTIRIPGVLNRSFTGTTRAESLDLFEDWLQGEGDSVDGDLTKLLQRLVEKSPVDPVAGNPNSLQSKMVDADWYGTIRGPFMQAAEEGEGYGSIFSVSIDGGGFQGCSRGCMDVSVIELPLEYQYNFENRRWSLFADLPITVTWTNDQISVLASVGIGGQYHVKDWWNLTLRVRFGGVGSLDVGALAILYSVSAINHMRWDLGPVSLGMGNQLGVANTFNDLTLGGTAIDYSLQNGYARNGLYLMGETGASLLRLPLGWEIYGNATNFFGDELFLENYGEVGGALSLVTPNGGAAFDRTRLHFSYVVGKDYDGFKLGLDFRF